MGKQIFLETICDSCAQLVEGHGFLVSDAGESHVRLESDHITIGFHYHQTRACELLIEISFKRFAKHGDIPFNLGEVFREFNVPSAKARSYAQLVSIEGIADFVHEACKALITFCEPVLKGEQSAFEALDARRGVESEHYTLSLRLTGARKELEEAWLSKNFAKYCILLNGLESVLSEAEKKKLRYAHQHMLKDSIK